MRYITRFGHTGKVGEVEVGGSGEVGGKGRKGHGEVGGPPLARSLFVFVFVFFLLICFSFLPNFQVHANATSDSTGKKERSVYLGENKKLRFKKSSSWNMELGRS